MTVVLRVLGAQMPDGIAQTPESNRYLTLFDVGAHDGRAPFPTVAKTSGAARFPNAGEALEFWRTQSRVVPLRPDGKPNRPLTALTVEIVRLPEVETP